mmetsp:Transcript_5943/g.12434  ORF Transcript_5943/g.12434 Transcript_5943/m.12434 type:complete len:783 (-) Transcript_5943:71-2419(-)|eukprot:CAMPEP_0194334596 /NCGR_PEP_ID=MMETSP0171-20130528/66620_1 /TAXON_ID=218684 /ORGANISM="Corethron pennatum, Strain L29A3" /LENGTH=782 /DNA_ID=CAMNT_0039097305 /DNA_START=63 /DNA_END=2411 /DNA_ORIENTATION=-
MASLSRAAAVLLAASVAVLPSPASSLVSFLPSSRLGCVRDRPSTLLLAGRRKEVPAAASAAAMGKKIRPGDVDTSKAVEKSKRRKALDEINSVSDLADVAADIHADAVSAAEPTGAANTPESAVAPSDEVEAQTAQIIIDEDTGMKSVQTGNAVMDVTTRRAVVLSPLGPQYRLAEMFPGVPPELRAQLRFDLTARPLRELIDEFAEAVRAADGSYPPAGSDAITEDGMDYLLSNRDQLGERMKLALTALKLRAQSKVDLEGARRWRDVRQQLIVLELKASAPFRQSCLSAEQTIGPRFGDLDVAAYCGGHVYERAGSWVVLKGLVALWEKRARDQRWREENPLTHDNAVEWMLMGDPRILLPKAEQGAGGAPPFYPADDCDKIASMCRRMINEFVTNADLFDDLPTELRFLERASVIPSGTMLRKFTQQEFCPEEGVTLEALAEGIQRLEVSLEGMLAENYNPLLKVISGVRRAIVVGTPMELDLYSDYIDNNHNPDSPGFFEIYHEDPMKGSMMEYLVEADGTANKNSIGDMNVVLNQLGIKGDIADGIGSVFGFNKATAKTDASGPKIGGTKRELTPMDDPTYHKNWLDALDDELRGLETADDRRRRIIDEQEEAAAEARREQGATRTESKVAGGVLIEYEVEDDGKEAGSLFDFLERDEKEIPPRKLNMFELSTYVFNQWKAVANSSDGVTWNGEGEETDFTGPLFEKMGARLFTQAEIDGLQIYEKEETVPSDEWYLKGFNSQEEYMAYVQEQGLAAKVMAKERRAELEEMRKDAGM